MKRAFAIGLLGLLMWQTAAQGLIFAWFKINQDAIEQRYCENKAKPKMQCHGNCHLNKQLQKTEQPASPLNIPNWTIKLKEVNFLIPDYQITSAESKEISLTSDYLTKSELEGYSLLLTKPPEVFS